jgi:patatin-like phospholipase/acyl hydrolase
VNRPAFRILSLDGGGIRGAFAAAFLAEIERTHGRSPAAYFDLIAGTSTGGIIALALALGEPAERIETFYLDRGKRVFTRAARRARSYVASPFLAVCRRWVPAGVDGAWLTEAKYQSEELRAALAEVFGERVIEESRSRLLVPAVDLVQGQTVVFKTPHLPGLVRDRRFRAVDVALATTAAPTYFPPGVIGTGSAYCDGGLWANNPGAVAYAEAVQIQARCTREGVDPKFERDRIEMLSIGTGRSVYSMRPPRAGTGILYWGASLLDVMGSAQSQGVDFQLRYLLGEERYARVDFNLPDKTWALDCVAVVDQLVHLGHEAAHTRGAEMLERFFADPAPAYTPFPVRRD